MNDDAFAFEVQQRVEKFKGQYGGPGTVVARWRAEDGSARYAVAHRIEDGFGSMIHIYDESQLRPDTVMTKEAVASVEAITKPETAQELRSLALQMERLANDSGVYSIVCQIIRNCADHICAIARIHEMNAEDLKRGETK